MHPIEHFCCQNPHCSNHGVRDAGNLAFRGWSGEGKRTYHHTAPINALYGLHEALVMLAEEGLQARWARHRQNHLALVAGLEAMGLKLLVAEKSRLPQLNSVIVPDGIDEPRVRADMLNKHGIEIGAGLGDLAGKIFRIGLMGTSSSPENVTACLAALKSVLADQR